MQTLQKTYCIRCKLIKCWNKDNQLIKAKLFSFFFSMKKWKSSITKQGTRLVECGFSALISFGSSRADKLELDPISWSYTFLLLSASPYYTVWQKSQKLPTIFVTRCYLSFSSIFIFKQYPTVFIIHSGYCNLTLLFSSSRLFAFRNIVTNKPMPTVTNFAVYLSPVKYLQNRIGSHQSVAYTTSSPS